MRTSWGYPSNELVLENSWVTVSGVEVGRDVDALFRAASLAMNGDDIFKYFVNIPAFEDLNTFRSYLEARVSAPAEVIYKVFSKRLGRLVGCASLMNIKPEHGTVEIGSIWYSKEAQRTEVNTNTMLLLFSYVFEVLEYRRLEWKCNNRNEDSKRAALRLGFQYEGLFRNHMVSRGENRDTAWYSIIDSEWPANKEMLIRKGERRGE